MAAKTVPGKKIKQNATLSGDRHLVSKEDTSGNGMLYVANSLPIMHACNILLADNNIGDQYLLKELVHQLDRSWRVHVAPSARQALQYLNHLTRADYPAMILMDHALPVKGALELLECLMHDPRYKQIPKFIWSAVGMTGGAEAYLSLGARGFLPKPQKASEAKALIRELLAGF